MCYSSVIQIGSGVHFENAQDSDVLLKCNTLMP